LWKTIDIPGEHRQSGEKVVMFRKQQQKKGYETTSDLEKMSDDTEILKL